MPYIAADGDNVGQLLAACYLSNDVTALKATKDLVDLKTKQIAEMLEASGYDIVFCAADGITAFSTTKIMEDQALYESVTRVSGNDFSFSVGVGSSLQEAYIALLFAKSTGKSRICNYDSMA